MYYEHMLMDYGWIAQSYKDEFIFIKAESTLNWTKIATKRMDDIIKSLRNGDRTAIDDAEQEIDSDNSDDDEDD